MKNPHLDKDVRGPAENVAKIGIEAMEKGKLSVIVGTIDKNDSVDPMKKERLKDHAKLVGNLLTYGLEKLFRSLRKI